VADVRDEVNWMTYWEEEAPGTSWAYWPSALVPLLATWRMRVGVAPQDAIGVVELADVVVAEDVVIGAGLAGVEDGAQVARKVNSL